MGPPTILPPLLSLPLPLFPSLSRRNLSVLPPLSFPLSSLFPKLGRSRFFSPYSTLVHPFSSPPFADLSFPPTDERSKRGTSVEFSRSDDFNLSSGRKRSGTRSKGVSLSLLSLLSSPRYSPPLFSPLLFLSRGEEPGGLVSILERRRSEERKRGESKKGEGISSACFDVVVGVVGGCTRVDRWMQQSWEGRERERERARVDGA